MFSLLALISLAALIVCIVLVQVDYNHDFGWETASVFAIILFVGFLAASIYNGCQIYRCMNVIPREIRMYEEENENVETKIANTVEKYMNYEKDIQIEVSPEDDAMSLVSLYPDLKADVLVQEEINVYIENNNKIKELKSELCNLGLYKFLVCFGK